MERTSSNIESVLIAYASEIFGKCMNLNSSTRICSDLGLCDEDLWDMINHALEIFNLPKPTNEAPAYIGIHQKDITFENLADWISRIERSFQP